MADVYIGQPNQQVVEEESIEQAKGEEAFLKHLYEEKIEAQKARSTLVILLAL